jgi:hypothetical protein
MRLDLKKMSCIVAGASLVCAVLLGAAMQNKFVTNPTTPDPANGLIFPYEAKGRLVFIDATSNYISHLLPYLAAISILVLVLIVIIHKGDPFKKIDSSR